MSTTLAISPTPASRPPKTGDATQAQKSTQANTPDPARMRPKRVDVDKGQREVTESVANPGSATRTTDPRSVAGTATYRPTGLPSPILVPQSTPSTARTLSVGQTSRLLSTSGAREWAGRRIPRLARPCPTRRLSH